ncbi:MAG: NAD-dependent deacylase [Candidatus Desulfofervidus auxilii]|nr:NAD-dependent deacylase [Candidatus Desulfofervidus auxilii]
MGKIKEVAKIIQSAHYVVALTGAGISAESGIPTFRGKQGLWQKYDPLEYAHIDAFLKNPAKVWRMLKELENIMYKVKPNPAHFVLAKMEKVGYLHAIITQNVDNLHQIAGSQHVIEFHGNAMRLRCLSCGKVYDKDTISFEEVPYCFCGGLLKPDVVFFGEAIPKEALIKAQMVIDACDVLLVIGTSAEVAPANYLPFEAKNHGAKIIEINIEPTHLTYQITDIFLKGKAGRILQELAIALAL